MDRSWCRSVYGFASLVFAVDTLFVYRAAFPIDVRPRHPSGRPERVYDGGSADGELPYVVFLSTALESSTTCVEAFCTGTLVHPWHVLTLLSCITRDNYRTNDVKIFLSRPYERAERNTAAYNVVKKAHYRPTGTTDAFDRDNVALLAMNGTFAGVTRFPRLASLEPVPHGAKLSCTTAGFSLLGRNLSRPIAETVRPAAYSVEVEFDVDECVNRRCADWYNKPDGTNGGAGVSFQGFFDFSVRRADPTDQNVYLCRTSGDGHSERTLCELGDEGGPLLCDRPASRDRRHGDRDADDADELYMYGMANVVPGAAGCRHGAATGRADVLYLYMYKYHFWVDVILTMYDEYEGRDGGSATTANGPTPSPLPPTDDAILSEYYDTDDYDRTAGKRPIRCDGRRRENAAAAAAAVRVSIDVLVAVASSLICV